MKNTLRQIVIGIVICVTPSMISQSAKAQDSPHSFTEPVVQIQTVQESPFVFMNEKQIRRIVEEVLDGRDVGPEIQGSLQERPRQPFQTLDVSTYADSQSDKLSVTLGNGGQLKIYGYGRGDLIYTTSRFNNAVVPFFVLSEDPASPTPVSEDDGQFNMNVRLTRLGIDYSRTQAQWFRDADVSAKIEIDFETLLNITSESRAVPRIRHAYGQMKWDEFSLLMGQTNDVISPLSPMINDDSLMWAAGNLGDRRPQIRATWDHNLCCGRHFIIASSLSSGGAIDQQDLDGNGIKDGEDSGFPALQQRFAYRFPSQFSDASAEIGAYWFLEWEDVQVPINGHHGFVSRGVGIDWSLPIAERVTWRGEAWYGKNLSDWRGGIAQGVNTTTGEEIESRGGWTELQLEAFEWWHFAVGVTVDDPVDNDLIGNATERTLNWTWYLGNRFNLGGGLNININLEFWNTDYLTLEDSDAMRFKTVLIQRF